MRMAGLCEERSQYGPWIAADQAGQLDAEPANATGVLPHRRGPGPMMWSGTSVQDGDTPELKAPHVNHW
jgi:hypothetical protein